MILNTGQFRWKELVFTVLIISLVFGLWMCEDEKMVQREYPRITGVSITNVSDSGATFIADLYSMGTEKIVEFGFLWSKSRNITVTGSEKICLGVPVNQGLFTAEITRALEEGAEYAVRPYVITDVQIVYGPETSFISMGSQAPVVYGFSPDSAGWGDTLTIRGKNFSSVDNDVYLNDIKILPATSSDTLIRAVIAGTVKTPDNLVSVSTAGNSTLFTQKQFRFVKPSIVDFNPKQAHWGDTLTIKGTYLGWLFISSTNLIKLGSFNCPIVGGRSDTLIRVMVPFEANLLNNPLSVVINGLTMTHSQQLMLLMPPTFTFTPKEGTWNSVVTMKGKFNIAPGKTIVKIGGCNATIISLTTDSIKVKVPSDIGNAKNDFKLSVSPFTIVASDSFRLNKPVIKSFTPTAGKTRSIVTIRGKFMNNGNTSNFTQVLFNKAKASIYSYKGDSVIVCEIPGNIMGGNVFIELVAGNQKVLSDTYFFLKNPIITDFYPKTATFDQEITIKGKGFVGESSQISFVKLGSQIIPLSLNDSVIVFRVPQTADSSHHTISVYVDWIQVTATEKFTLKPPEITGISPEIITTAGQDIIINGAGFHPKTSGNLVKWGIYPLTIKNSSVNQITATLPTVMTRNNDTLKITIGGYQFNKVIVNQISSPWISSPFSSSFTMSSSHGSNGASFVLGSKIFLIDLTGAYSSYDPVLKQLQRIGTEPKFSYNAGLSAAILRDTAYIMTTSNGLFRYNESGKNWQYLCQNPFAKSKFWGTMFNLNDRIYFGITVDANTRILDKTFWVYNTKSKTWTQKQSLPETTSKEAVAHFSMNNKAYVIMDDHKFYEYDPASDSWNQLQNYPGTATPFFGISAFVLNGKVYAGQGWSSYGSVSNDLYLYERDVNSWSVYGKIPSSPRYNALSVGLNNKGYIILGQIYNAPYVRDILEFNPDYTE